MAGSEALNAAMTPPIMTMRLRRYSAGDTRLIMVSGPPHRKTTFSNCMKISMETIDSIAAAHHSHRSTGVWNSVFQDMRWSAPSEAPKGHVIGQRILEWYTSGSQFVTTISLAGGLTAPGRQAELFSFKFSPISFSCTTCLASCEAAFCWASCEAYCSASRNAFCWASCNALSSASFSNTRGVRYQMVQSKSCFPIPSSSNALLTAIDSKVIFRPGSMSGRSTTDGVRTSFGLTHQKKIRDGKQWDVAEGH